jgi:PEGA domain-containing protein
LFAASYEEPRLFAASAEVPRRRSGLSIWFAAAASLVVGIVIGFASGYRAGQGMGLSLPSVLKQERRPSPTTGIEQGGESPSGRPFSESTVTDPTRIDPEPIVPAPATPSQQPAPAPAAPAPVPAAAAPAPAPAPSNPPRAAAPERTPARRTPPSAPAVATGPGTVRVLSRPAGAQVVFDGQVVGKTPLEIGAVAPGQHSIRLELTGFKLWATTVDVKAGSDSRVAASLEE